MKLFIDDERHPPENWSNTDYTVLRSFDSVISWMVNNGCPKYISFDHDLGEGKTGYDVALWIVNRDIDCKGTFMPPGFEYTVHSMNPVGRQNIIGLLFPYLADRKT